MAISSGAGPVRSLNLKRLDLLAKHQRLVGVGVGK